MMAREVERHVLLTCCRLPELRQFRSNALKHQSQNQKQAVASLTAAETPVGNKKLQMAPVVVIRPKKRRASASSTGAEAITKKKKSDDKQREQSSDDTAETKPSHPAKTAGSKQDKKAPPAPAPMLLPGYSSSSSDSE